MAIGSSRVCGLAVVTSFASPAITHEEADYYMVGGKIEAPPPDAFLQSTHRLARNASLLERRAEFEV
jgi:hypothetical protein